MPRKWGNFNSMLFEAYDFEYVLLGVFQTVKTLQWLHSSLECDGSCRVCSRSLWSIWRRSGLGFTDLWVTWQDSLPKNNYDSFHSFLSKTYSKYVFYKDIGFNFLIKYSFLLYWIYCIFNWRALCKTTFAEGPLSLNDWIEMKWYEMCCYA